MTRALLLLFSLIHSLLSFAQSTPALSAVMCRGDTAFITAQISDADSLQWYRNEVSVSGARGDSLMTLQEGIYYVKAFKGKDNGCVDESGRITIIFDESKLNDDTFFVQIGKTTTIDVLDNDEARCAPFDRETFRIVNAPKSGTIVKSEDGVPHYRPVNGEPGTDSFSYTVNDIEGREIEAANVVIQLVIDCAIVYPNPVGQFMYVTVNEQIVKALKLYDATGREVYRQTIEAPHTSINTSAFADGWYMLECVKYRGESCFIKLSKK